ncbi:MAG: transcriptional repressor LexA [Halobacteriovoraceae bacterium]|jgi:repressor LexA|nr:transcriptional repressor LexA [Halobacteriovoraceae bacterium]
MGITKKQKEIYDYIKSYIDTHSCAPTQKEIKEHFSFKSFGSVQRYIKYLTDAGYLGSDWNARRGLTLVEEQALMAAPAPHSREIPLLGKVAAGIPIEALEDPEETIPVPLHMLSGDSRYFALKVEGDSMIDEGIFQDDIVVCKGQETAHTGQTVVAVIDGEATVKNFYKKKGIIELHPANSTMQPIIVDGSLPFKIAGVLVGLIRSYV